MNPEIKAAIENQSKEMYPRETTIRCDGREDILMDNEQKRKGFITGAEYGYKLAEEKLDRVKDALERILINPMPWYIDKVAREALEKLGK